MVPEHLLETHTSDGPDYKPLTDQKSWRVALMNYSHDMLPEKINRMQPHLEVDDFQVLLKGHCLLLPVEGGDRVTNLLAMEMEPNKLYNVQMNCWHSQPLSEEARVLIVENCEPDDANSPYAAGHGHEQQEEIVRLRRDL